MSPNPFDLLINSLHIILLLIVIWFWLITPSVSVCFFMWSEVRNRMIFVMLFICKNIIQLFHCVQWFFIVLQVQWWMIDQATLPHSRLSWEKQAQHFLCATLRTCCFWSFIFHMAAIIYGHRKIILAFLETSKGGMWRQRHQKIPASWCICSDCFWSSWLGHRCRSFMYPKVH